MAPHGPIRAHMGPYGPQPGQGPNTDRAPTRTGPQPGPGRFAKSGQAPLDITCEK